MDAYSYENEGSTLFTPIFINGLHLKNRIVKAPTMESMATEDGAPTDKLFRHYTRAAKGGSGLLMMGLCYVSKEGKAYPHESGIYEDRLVPEWKRFTDTVHEAGGKIVMQISHGGRQIDPSLLDGRKAKAASSFPNLLYLYQSKKLDDQEIRKIIQDFGAAAGRVKEAGFDAIQIHSSGGYLLAGFLSPMTNWRRDDWGGDERRRFHFFEEIYKVVRQSVGENYPVFAKIHLGDFLIMGRPFPANYKAALWAQNLGIDALELAIGIMENCTITFSKGDMPISIIDNHIGKLLKNYWKMVALCYKPFSKVREPYFQTIATELKKQGLTIPLLLAGGIRKYDEANQIIKSGTADLIGMSRAIIREPNLPQRWMNGDRRDSTCVSCNKCLLDMGINANPIKCHYVKGE
jgi:2,4-dienoyl-CoA reductase-like NADH-dependent reductase (Old Yellow Enzyme family)